MSSRLNLPQKSFETYEIMFVAVAHRLESSNPACEGLPLVVGFHSRMTYGQAQRHSFCYLRRYATFWRNIHFVYAHVGPHSFCVNSTDTCHTYLVKALTAWSV